MKVLVTFDDGKTKVFDNIDRIDHSYYRGEIEFTNFKGSDEEDDVRVDLNTVLKIEVFV